MAKAYTQTQLDWLNTLSGEDQAKYNYNPSTYKPPTNTTKKPKAPADPNAPLPPRTSTNPTDIAKNLLHDYNDWNTAGKDIGQQAINYGQNNPYSQDAQGYIHDALSGGMGNNPWMGNLWNNVSDVNMDESFDYLRDFLGPAGGGTGGSPSDRATMARLARGGTSYQQSNAGGGGGMVGGGMVPDTVGQRDSFFAEQAKKFFDPSRLDPANDPTLQPYIEAMRKENAQNLYASLQDLSARAEGAGAYGSGLYRAMDSAAREQGMESMDQAIAQAMMGSRGQSLEAQQNILGLTNNRDIAEMQNWTQRYGIDQAAASAGAGAGAAAADAAEGRRLQAISMMMQGSQYGLGMQGNMAELMSQNQLGALQAGLGYGQLGMEGYNTALNGGQLGLGSLNGQFNVGQGLWQMDQANKNNNFRRMQWQDQQQQNALDSYLQILQGIGGMGSDGSQTNPGQYYPGGPDPWAAGISAGGGSAMQNYAAWQKMFGGQ